MSEWRPIATAPKDGTAIILYWTSHAYEIGEAGTPHMAVGAWKVNPRINANVVAEYPTISAGYFSNTGEWDDYGLALAENAPTHWMPMPKPPEGAQ